MRLFAFHLFSENVIEIVSIDDKIYANSGTSIYSNIIQSLQQEIVKNQNLQEISDFPKKSAF